MSDDMYSYCHSMIFKCKNKISWVLILTCITVFSTSVTAKSQWTISKEEDGIIIFVKSNKGSPLKAFKGEMIVDSRITPLIAVLNDTKAHTKLLYNCKSAIDVKKVSDVEGYKYIVTSMPWPVANRDMVTHSTLFQNQKNKQVEIKLKAVSKLIPLKPNMVRIKTMSGRWLFTPIFSGNDSGKTKVSYEVSLDPGGKIPKWLVNTLAVDFPFYTLQNLRQLAKQPVYQQAKLSYINE